MKAREQNSATESSSLGKCQGYRKESWSLCWDNVAIDRLALTDEFKLGEDSSDLIKDHPELNSVSKTSVASTRIPLLTDKLITNKIMNEC